MTITVASLKRDCYALIDSGSAFSAVRASLGAGSASVIPVADLSAATLPTAPFLAVGYGPVSGQAQDVRTLFPTIWLYDDVPEGHYRLNAIAALIEAALIEPDALLPGAELRLAGIDREDTDPIFARPVLPVRLTLKARF